MGAAHTEWCARRTAPGLTARTDDLAEQYSNSLTKILKVGNLSYHDQLVAQSFLDDLQNALATP